MKIAKNQLQELIAEKHIFLLTEEELQALAFLLNIEITDYKKTAGGVKFKMRQENSVVFIECSPNGCAAIGKSNKMNYKTCLSGLTAYGGCFHFSNVVKVFRIFYLKSYTLTIQSKESLKQYEKKEWKSLVLAANYLVEAA